MPAARGQFDLQRNPVTSKSLSSVRHANQKPSLTIHVGQSFKPNAAVAAAMRPVKPNMLQARTSVADGHTYITHRINTSAMRFILIRSVKACALSRA